MKRIIILILIVINVACFGQTPTGYIKLPTRYDWIAGKFDSTFTLPFGNVQSIRGTGYNHYGALFYKSGNSSVYAYDGSTWRRLVDSNLLRDTAAAIRSAIGSVSVAGNYGNLQINRNGVLSAPSSDTLIYTTSGGFVIKNIITGNALYLPNSTTSLGAIYTNSIKWMHDYSPGSSPNQAWGINAGSLSTASTNTSNISIGDGAGANFNSTGNIAIGYRALSLHTGVDPAQDLYNTAIGYNSMGLATGGRNNVAVGVNTLRDAANGSYSNVAIGKGTALGCTTCGANSIVGASVASGGTFTGEWNSIVGADVLVPATSATGNSILGAQAMYDGTTAQENTIAGYYGGTNITTATGNAFLGAKTGLAITDGSYNVFLGYGAGAGIANTSISNRFSLNKNTALTAGNATMIGDLTNKRIGINKAEDATLTYELTVGGKAAIETIDSTGTGTAINMLYQDPSTGLIKKAAVPSGGGGSGDILNGGNTTAATVTVGTNDANAFNLETTNVTRVAIGATGGTTIGNTSGGTGVVPLTVDAPSGLTTDMARFTKNGFSTGYFVIDKDGFVSAIGSNAAKIQSSGTLVSFPTGITFNSLTAALGYGILSTDGSAGTFGSTPFVFDMSANTTDSRNNLLLRNSNATNPGYNLKAITSGNIQQFIIDGTGKVAIGTQSPTAMLHLPAGTATANTAPLKQTAGTLLTTAEAGAAEYNNSHYETKNSGLRYAMGGVIADFYTDAANSGTAQTDLYSYTLPANTFANDGEKISFSYAIEFSDATSTANLKIVFAGNNVALNTFTLTATASATVFGYIIRTGSTTARTCITFAMGSANGTPSTYVSNADMTGLDFTTTNIIKLTGTAGGAGGGSNDITAKSGTISWQGKAAN